MELAFNKEDIKKRMDSTIEVFTKDLAGLRTGRASTNLLEPITVEAYGGKTAINQVANVTIGDSRLLIVNVWDKDLVKNVEKAIRDSGLGLNPATEGQTIRVPLPELNAERRQELVKVAGKMSEESKIAIRHLRRDGMELLKELEKKKAISEDEHHRHSEELQKLTDIYVKKIDELAEKKEQEILKI